jgi:hypothetical protein
MEVKRTLEWLKSELEKNFKVIKSYIVQLQPDVIGNTADKFVFEEESGICVDIDYWDTGVVIMGAGKMTDEELIIDLMHVPTDYHLKFYPKESEDIFVQKVNDLLVFLHNQNPNIPPKLPESF